MKLIVGLGNPGSKYRQTRHNLGYEVVGETAHRLGASGPRSRFSGELIQAQCDGQAVSLLCPTTYMNRSGESVRKAVDFYQLPLEDLLVVCDDFQLPLGIIRFRPHGSAGGQKGLSDVIGHLKTESFSRLRLGIGPVPPHQDATSFVLQRFPDAQWTVALQTVGQASTAVLDWIRHGTQYCMNQYNRRSKITEEEKS
jgi:PTH1 family peptidyl-tRNA hydrolase